MRLRKALVTTLAAANVAVLATATPAAAAEDDILTQLSHVPGLEHRRSATGRS